MFAACEAILIRSASAGLAADLLMAASVANAAGLRSAAVAAAAADPAAAVSAQSWTELRNSDPDAANDIIAAIGAGRMIKWLL